MNNLDKQLEEIWKPIEGYEEFYEISSLGRVRSFSRMVLGPFGKYQERKGRILKPFIITGGYWTVALCKNKKCKFSTIHRLFAKAFIPNPNNYPCINHINNDRKDNRIENLEWCTHQQNMAHARKQHRLMRRRKLAYKDVLEIRRAFANKEKLQQDLAVIYDTSPQLINMIIKNKIYRFPTNEELERSKIDKL